MPRKKLTKNERNRQAAANAPKSIEPTPVKEPRTKNWGRMDRISKHETPEANKGLTIQADEFEAGTGVYLQCQHLCGEDYRLKLTRRMSVRLKAFAKQHGTTELEIIDQLMDFYNLRDLALLINRINRLYNRGLTPIERGYLSTLYTLLAEIDRQTGLGHD
jgi:hypothetical protein